MNREDFVKAIALDLEDIVMENYYDEKGSKWCAELIVKHIEELGLKPPCLDGDKCQFLMHKFMDPHFNYWDEQFENRYGKEYNEWKQRRNK